MRRATVTIPDDLAEKVDAYSERQPAGPSLTALVQAALRRFLAEPEGSSHQRPVVLRVLSNRAAIKDAAARHGASNVRLFGSVARGEALPGSGSDVDLLVTLEDGRTLFDIARLRVELEEMLHTPVDVVADSGLSETDPIVTEALNL
jgi:predicted nucleotidyltransferase